MVDQFGYLPDSEKIAVLRDPQTGYDSAESYVPAASYDVVDAESGDTVTSVSPTAWSGGAEHPQSGDVAWWVDFSTVTEPGVYFVRDGANGVRSPIFRVAPDVYREVMRHALRTFFYQRAGFAKDAEFAGADWADGASHVGPGQDTECRLYSATADATTQRDVSGGWYDAGDYNKYTAWTADYIVQLLRAYEERPEAFRDDLGIPESGNCIPDVIDETRFGLEHLVRLQNEDGSVLSIVDMPGGSPPSSVTDPTRYGPASTNATQRAAAAYAAGARVLSDFDEAFADDLRSRALLAWDWVEANPNVIFANNDGSNDLGAGNQEVSDDDRQLWHTVLAVELYRLTGDAAFKAVFEADFEDEHYGPIGYYVAAWQLQFHDYYLDYAALPDADPTVRSTFLDRYLGGLDSDDNLGALTAHPDPYMAYVADYVWGSNAHKARTGLLQYSVITYGLDASKEASARTAAERYLHYLHGVNPLGFVYLSNMGIAGAERGVTQFYHTWFGEGTAWDTNPAPGFLAGGPNPSYAPTDEGPTPPLGQPDMKSYADFNDGWPVNSWEVTENSNGYQVAYIRLLSKFVN